MTNLLTETIEFLKEHGKTPKQDVLWVGSIETGKFSWALFEKLADRDYDDGHGGQEVCSDLLIVGKDWWMERGEYDGAEWWEFKQQPEPPEKTVEPDNLFAEVGWENLEDLMSREAKV